MNNLKIVMAQTNKFWTVLAFIFLYLGLAIPGPLHFSGNVFTSFCMFCEQTEEYSQFRQVNHFLRGFFSLSVALIIYAQWKRIIAIMSIVAVIYFPINDLHEYIQTGEYHSVYLFLPLIVKAVSEPWVLWMFYSSYEMLLMLIGAMIALINYGLIHKVSHYNPRIVVPVFALFFIGFSAVFMIIFKQSFGMITIHNGIIFGLAVLFGLRFFITEVPKKSMNL